MREKKKAVLDFSQREVQRTFDWTRKEVEQAWDEQRDRKVGDWDALAARLTSIQTYERFVRYADAQFALAAYLADGEPTD